MRLATVRTPTGTAAVRVDDAAAVELGAADLGEGPARLEAGSRARVRRPARARLAGLGAARPDAREDHLCRAELPHAHPGDGPRAARHATPEQAVAGIAGYTAVNDVTERDFQHRFVQWFPGGVGHARRPPRYLAEGLSLVTRVEGVGELRTTMVKGA